MKYYLLFLFAWVFVACADNDDSLPSPPVCQHPVTYDEAVYRVAQLAINTENGAEILGKEKKHYVNCEIHIDSEYSEWDASFTGRIRGRGNSTWLWYPKKPYRIKLDEKASVLGLEAEKDWVLLANYRDPTHLMNTFAFVAGAELGLPYTNHTRFVEVTLNGEYIGLYQLTEQVEQGSSRVDVSDEGGMLLSLDRDDGPELAPDEGDNFWSAVYGLPVCVKHPEDQTAAQLADIRQAFAQLETTIKSTDYDRVAQVLDIPSFIDYLLLQELVYNVEIDAPRSVYIHKDVGGKWTMGPLWDFDAGFDFDWNSMYTGHNYFMSYKELVMGTDPANHVGGYRVPDFFTDLFKNPRFLSAYQDRWMEIRDKVMAVFWENSYLYAENAAEAMQRNAARWPIDKDYSAEINRMKQWLFQRVNYLDNIIANYPK